MTIKINRNFIFLEVFSVTLIGAIALNIWEYVATLASNDPNGYVFTLFGYVIVIAIIAYIIYFFVHTPPKFEKIINKADKRQTKLLDGLKTKMQTIDEKQAKKEMKKEKKILKQQINTQEKESRTKSVSTTQTSKKTKPTPVSSSKNSSSFSSTSNKASSKNVRRRK